MFHIANLKRVFVLLRNLCIVITAAASFSCNAKELLQYEEGIKYFNDIKIKEFRDFISTNDGQIFIYDYANQYPWLKDAKILSIGNYKDFLIFYIKNKMAILLNKDGGGTSAISEIIKYKYEKLPINIDEQYDMLHEIARLRISYGALFCSRDAYKKLEDHNHVKSWLHGEETRMAVFKSYFDDPVMTSDDKNGKWSSVFYVIDINGGVYKLHAGGTSSPFSIENIEVDEIKKKYTFSYPIVG